MAFYLKLFLVVGIVAGVIYGLFFADLAGQSLASHIGDVWRSPVVQRKRDLAADGVLGLFDQDSSDEHAAGGRGTDRERDNSGRGRERASSRDRGRSRDQAHSQNQSRDTDDRPGSGNARRAATDSNVKSLPQRTAAFGGDVGTGAVAVGDTATTRDITDADRQSLNDLLDRVQSSSSEEKKQ